MERTDPDCSSAAMNALR